VVDVVPAHRHAAPSARSGFLKRCFPTRLALLIAVFVCVIAPVALVGVHIHENPEFSPIDEAAHLDYVIRIADGGFPRMGQYLQKSTQQLQDCRGLALHGLVLPACGAPIVDNPKFGTVYQYEAQQPPGYYALTVPMRWAGIHVLGIDDLTATRLTGLVWLVLGLLLFWAAGRVMGVPPPVLGAGALLIATAPLVIYTTSYVSNDAAAVFAGALVLFVGALAYKQPGRWMTPVMVLVGLFVGSLKLNDVLPVVVISFLFALAAGAKLRGEEEMSVVEAVRWWWPRGGSILLGSIICVVGWLVIERKLAIINPRDLPTFAVLRVGHYGYSTIAREALSMFQPLTGAYDPFRTSSLATPASSVVSTDLQSVLATVLAYLVIAGALAGLFVSPRRWSHWLGLVSVPVLYVGGVVLGISVYLTYNSDPGLSGRYGLVLAPFVVMALTSALRGAWLIWALWIFGLTTFALSFYFMFAG
jgi:hypothetical protein